MEAGTTEISIGPIGGIVPGKTFYTLLTPFLPLHGAPAVLIM